MGRLSLPGSQGGLKSQTIYVRTTIISAKYLPFQIRFVSDSYEFADEAENAPQGFKLQYRLRDCT